MFGRRTIGRVLALVVCSVAVVFAAACGGGGQGGGGGGGGNQGPFTIGISNGFISSEWRTQMIDDLQTVNDEYKQEGLTEDLVIESADTDPQGQIQQMRNLINRGVDAIIVNPNDATALDQVIGQAEQAGIPVIAVDQEIAAPGVTNVVIDQGEWARMGAEWLVEELGGEGRRGGDQRHRRPPGQRGPLRCREGGLRREPGHRGGPGGQRGLGPGDGPAGDVEHPRLAAEHRRRLDAGRHGARRAAGRAGRQPREVPGDLRRGPLRLHEAVGRRCASRTRASPPTAPINPPGVGASGLRVAVELLQGKEIKQSELQGEAGNTLYVPIPGVVTNQNLERGASEDRHRGRVRARRHHQPQTGAGLLRVGGSDG